MKAFGYKIKKKNIEYTFLNAVKAENVEQNEEHRFTSDEEMKDIKDKLNNKPNKTDPLTDNTVIFTQSKTRTNIKSEETLEVLFGKIKKWFTDLKAAAFTDVSTSLDIEAEGYVLDARAAKTINDKFGGLQFYEDSNGKWVVGADSVPKKLGNGFETVIGVCYCARSKDIGQTVNGESVYGSIAEFDLTAIPDYKSLKFGENIIAIATVAQASQSIDQLMYITKEDQKNVSIFDYDSANVTDYLELVKQDIPNWYHPDGKPFNWRQNFIRYVPGTGRLYAMAVKSTLTISSIGLFRT